jgi:hypothetical protein
MTTVTVTDDAGRTINLRPRMNWGTRQRVSGAAYQRANGRGDRMFNIDDYNMALLLFNVVSWAGPGLDGVPITTDGIMALDADTDTVIELAFAKVAELNQPRSDDEEKKDTTSIAPGTEATTE